MNQELSTLLRKLDVQFEVDRNGRHYDNTIHGFIGGQPAKLRLSTKIGGSINPYGAQIIFHVIMGERCVCTWGCVDDADTRQLLEWWFALEEHARTVTHCQGEMSQTIWDNL